MPVYEYECKACGRDFEYQQRMSDPDKTICEVCGGALDRLISRTAFSLKGGGWYKDLYASPKPESGDKGGKADKAGGESGGGKADAPAASADKPAAKPDSGAGGSSAGGGGSGGTGSTSGGSASSTSAAAAKAT